ncbi:transposase [Cucumis melo var. makuwa]|uniref:Transposase n=1 Tax=Cucumis melo var. makuwa TaxID=1194695 RepID=A0A5A7TK13_CUCMM|nr:transposase [Cucumis melo var. makuwa]TYK06333.1 transposase [Cucumis melo var. makuwa]
MCILRDHENDMCILRDYENDMCILRITRLLCVSFGITKLICASFGITRLICKGMARGRPARDKKDAHGEELPNSFFHGESFKCMYEENDARNIKEMVEIGHEQYSKDPSGFEKLLNDAEKSHGWSNISFLELLKALKGILPSPNDLPTSMYEAKKMLGALGMEYEKIHVCPNDCYLYRKEYANAIVCLECGESRWKYGKDANMKKKIPTKIMWKIDDKLRHPADSPPWKLIDTMWPSFSSEPRNLRLALSADGINPYSDMSSKYSCWPVMTVIYNLPPWLCTLLDIPGKTKDGLNARRDLADLKIRPELTSINGEKKIHSPYLLYTY